MADPAVCAFLAKVLCGHGGRLQYGQLPSHLPGLSAQQLRQILEQGAPERFLLTPEPGGAGDPSSRWVLAVSAVRLCPQRECLGCDRLHLCKLNLLGRCRVRACKYSHDIFSEKNRSVLKSHELSGLNEDELRVLLLQNDPFLLTDVCNLYNKGDGNCPQQDDCNRLHVCRFFLRGTCRFPKCKRSHKLLEPNALKLLLAEGVDDKMAWNIQTICAHKTAELAKELPPQKMRNLNPPTATSGEKKKTSVVIQGEYRPPPTLPFTFMKQNIQQVPSSNPTTATSGEKQKTSVVIQEEYRPSPNQDSLPFVSVNWGIQQGVKAAPPPPKPPQKEEKKKSDEICLFYVWQFCKQKSKQACEACLVVKGRSLLLSKRNHTWDGIRDCGCSWTSQSGKMPEADGVCARIKAEFAANCDMIHYHLPYRWQVYTGTAWNDCSQMEEIEKAYCDPSITSLPKLNINFSTMMSYFNPVRRQSTPSSVTKPARFVFTTKWLWYWKNDQGKWIEYGEQDGQRQGSTLTSDDLENVFLSQPEGSFQFQAGSQTYEMNFKDMIQKNLNYQTRREVRRRPKYVSPEDVKKKKGHKDRSSAPIPSIPEQNYPKDWDKSALPEIGYKLGVVLIHSEWVDFSSNGHCFKPAPPPHFCSPVLMSNQAVELSKTSSEYTTIEKLFKKTMDAYVIVSIRRIQNPSLWQVFQWQKEQMKKKKGGLDVEEKFLFHGTKSSLEAICNDNFDWRICGANGTVYGKGSYFAKDARYSHQYCQVDAKVKSMFVARVLVGDFVVGHSTYNRPPPKSSDVTNCYDSCVDRMMDPSIFIIFEKHQIYPAYVISYTDDKKCVLA